MTWKPLPPDSEDMTAVPISASLERLTSYLGIPSTDTLSIVFSRWNDVVGSELGKHARPQSLVDGALIVIVDDAAWGTQLKWLGPSLVERLNEAANTHAVEHLEVRIGRH